MCTTALHEVRGGGTGSAATIATGPLVMVVPVAVPVSSAGWLPVTSPTVLDQSVSAGGAEAVALLCGSALPGFPPVLVCPGLDCPVLDSRALAVDELGGAGERALDAVSFVPAATPTASRAAPSRHIAAAAGDFGSPGRRSHPLRCSPPVPASSVPGSPVT